MEKPLDVRGSCCSEPVVGTKTLPSDAPPQDRPVLMVLSDKLGEGDPELGRLLLRAALKTAADLPRSPQIAIFMNMGVHLCCDGSSSLDDLRKLEAKGCRILCCGTCLDFYQLKGSLKVGSVSNMLEILSLATSAARLVRL
jgi:selenium metabolism protein YedF